MTGITWWGSLRFIFTIALFTAAGIRAERVSIVMPAYNSAPYIGMSIQSVQLQTHRDWELIIVNDGSTDGTAEIADYYAGEDSRIRVVHLAENGGVGNARNQGLPLATGRYVAFLDSDDLWKPRKLARQLEFMQAGNIAFSFTAFRILQPDGSEGRNAIRASRPTFDYESLLWQNQVPLFTVMLDRTLVGEFAFATTYNEDFLLWLHLTKKNILAHFLDEVQGSLRRLPTSISANKARAAKEYWIVLREREELPLFDSALYFANYAVKGLFRYIVQYEMGAGLLRQCLLPVRKAALRPIESNGVR